MTNKLATFLSPKITGIYLSEADLNGGPKAKFKLCSVARLVGLTSEDIEKFKACDKCD